MPLGPALTATSSEEQGGEVITHAQHKCHLKADEWQGQLSHTHTTRASSPAQRWLVHPTLQELRGRTSSLALKTSGLDFLTMAAGREKGHISPSTLYIMTDKWWCQHSFIFVPRTHLCHLHQDQFLYRKFLFCSSVLTNR